MDKNKIKKYIMSLFIILVIAIICIVLLIQYFTSEKYIMSLLNKGNENVNYIVSYEDGEMIDYAKGFEEKLVFSTGIIYYANYSTGESILINPEDKTIELGKVESTDNPNSSLYLKDINEMTFEYEGEKKISSNECIVIKLSDNQNNNQKYLTKKIYINKSNGVIEKIEKYKSTLSGEDTLISTKNYKMHTGEATDEDVKIPDLTEYSGYTTINNR